VTVVGHRACGGDPTGNDTRRPAHAVDGVLVLPIRIAIGPIPLQWSRSVSIRKVPKEELGCLRSWSASKLGF
jgi:hypothetical protein